MRGGYVTYSGRHVDTVYWWRRLRLLANGRQHGHVETAQVCCEASLETCTCIVGRLRMRRHEASAIARGSAVTRVCVLSGRGLRIARA